MTRNGVFMAGCLIGAAGVLTGCKDQEARAQIVAAQAKIDLLEEYLGQENPKDLYPWEVKIQIAICQLETNNPGGLDPAKRICTGGPPDITPPPKYPPR